MGWPKGKPRGMQSAEHRRKNSEGNKGRVFGSYKDTERAKKIGLANKGKPKPLRTAEHCAAISRALKGRKQLPEHRENNRKAQTGVPRQHPADFVERCKLAQRRRWFGYISKNVETRDTYSYFKWRDLVFERDKHTCQKCGTTVQQLRKFIPGPATPENSVHAHHLKSWIEYLELRFSVENGMTLCPSCHRAAHKKLLKVVPLPRPITARD